MCPIRFRTSSALRLANQFSGVLVIVLCLIPSLLAQVDRAGLSGAVTDPSGRVLPQTHITAVQTSTDLKREAVASAATLDAALPETFRAIHDLRKGGSVFHLQKQLGHSSLEQT